MKAEINHIAYLSARQARAAGGKVAWRGFPGPRHWCAHCHEAKRCRGVLDREPSVHSTTLEALSPVLVRVFAKGLFVHQTFAAGHFSELSTDHTTEIR